MDRVVDFREQAVKAKHEVAAQQEENKELKARIEQVNIAEGRAGSGRRRASTWPNCSIIFS